MSTLVQSSATQFSLLFPPNPAFAADPPNGGILLNRSRSPSSSPALRHRSLPPVNEPLPAVNVDRKIRFAPLPVPRKDNKDTSDSYDSDESNSPNNKSIPSPSSVTIGQNVTDGLSVSPNLSSSNSEDGSSSVRERESKWSRKLLKPFFSSNISPHKASFEDLSRSLFKISSRDSLPAEDINSANANTSGTSSSKKRTSPSSPNQPPVNPLSLRPSSSGDGAIAPKRLLNGRVYGRRSHDTTGYDGSEPAFVEWGYGGMGSLKQSESHGRGSAFNSVHVQSGAGEDDEYGTGMDWVKRRRKKREEEAAVRKAKEEEELKQKQREKQREKEIGGVPQITVQPPVQSNPSSPTKEKNPMNQFQTSPGVSSDKVTMAQDMEKYSTTTVSIPHHHQSHHHPTSRTNSEGSIPNLITHSISSSSVGSHRPKDLHIETNVERKPAPLSISSDEDEDDEDADEEKDDEEEEEEDDDDDDDSEAELRDECRLTSLSAGNEKISRHKNQAQ